AALVLDAIAVSLIVREITGRTRGCWFAGAAFLAIFGIFYASYAGINDPQVAANLCVTCALLVVLRRLDGNLSAALCTLVVPLLLLGGLLKHSVLAVPLSIAIFLFAERCSGFLVLA